MITIQLQQELQIWQIDIWRNRVAERVAYKSAASDKMKQEHEIMPKYLNKNRIDPA